MPLLAPCLSIALFLGAGAPGSGARIVGASSFLKQKTRVAHWTGGTPHWRPATFAPASAMDGRYETAWCEGAPGQGIGEWLEFEIDHPVEGVWISAGFSKISIDPQGDSEQAEALFKKSLDVFKSNSRPSLLELTTADGTLLEGLQLGDRTDDYPFAVRLEPGRYRLRIAQVYPGTSFEDTCITEVRFDAVKQHPVAKGLFAPLRPFAHRWSCRAGSKTTVLPQELRFLGQPEEPQWARGHNQNSESNGAERFSVAVRDHAGVLLPTILDAECFWGGLIPGFHCLESGEETEAESLDDASLDYPAWRIELKHADRKDATGPWTVEFTSRDGAVLKMDATLEPASSGFGPIVLTAIRAGTPIETARYACAPLP